MNYLDFWIKISYILSISFSLSYFFSIFYIKIKKYRYLTRNIISGIVFACFADICIVLINKYFDTPIIDGKNIFVLITGVIFGTLASSIVAINVMIVGYFIFRYYTITTIFNILSTVVLGILFSRILKKKGSKKFPKYIWLSIILLLIQNYYWTEMSNLGNIKLTEFIQYYIPTIILFIFFSYALWRVFVYEVEQQESREKIIDSEKRYKLLSLAAYDGLWEYNFKTKEFYVSDRLCQLYGYSIAEKEFVINNRTKLSSIEDVCAIQNEVNALIKGEKDRFILECKIFHKTSGYRWVLFNGVALRDDEGILIKIAGSLEDIHEKKLQEEKLKKLAYFDQLTGLPNRKYFFDKLDENIYKINTVSGTGAVLYIDVDDFKIINDNYGHSYGDILLKEIGNRLSLKEYNETFVARLGGDEFVIVIDGETSEALILEYVNNLIEKFREPFHIEENEFTVTISIGIVNYPRHGKDAESILKNADIAMYYAKGKGKNRFALFNDYMNKENLEQLNLERDLKKALKNNEFLIYYQPQYKVSHREICSFEALIRWSRPGYGMVPPIEFINFAEKRGLIIDIGAWVFKEACIFVNKLNNFTKQSYIVYVNVSSVQLMSENFVNTIKSIIIETGVNPKQIGIEITETALMESFSISTEKIEILSAMGINISLDDFGTGYSSLNYLRKIPVNEVKIDKSFIDDILNDDKQKKLTKTIIDISHDLDLNVIAEGVETEDQFQLLEALNCDEIQGYLFSKPIPENEIFNLCSKI